MENWISRSFSNRNRKLNSTNAPTQHFCVATICHCNIWNWVFASTFQYMAFFILSTIDWHTFCAHKVFKQPQIATNASYLKVGYSLCVSTVCIHKFVPYATHYIHTIRRIMYILRAEAGPHTHVSMLLATNQICAECIIIYVIDTMNNR